MTDTFIGQLLANYKILRPLGSGGMAQVYLAEDVNLARQVAVKVIDAKYRKDPAFAERFVAEARTVASWNHDNIIRVYYADNVGDAYFFAMEFVDGMSLDNLLHVYTNDGELMPHAEVIRIGRAIADALDYAHERDVIHRDVKPSNVMVARDNRVVLMDFGLALNMQQGSIGEVLGTPHYVAPEQARNSASAVPQSDLYALGVMLYEMLVGVVPFDDPSFGSVIAQHLGDPPPPPREINPRLNEGTERVLLRALEKEPSKRYTNGIALIRALESVLVPDNPSTQPSIVPPSERAISRMAPKDKMATYITRTARADNPTAATIPPSTPQQLEIAKTSVRKGRRQGVLITLAVVVLMAVLTGLLVVSSGAFGTPPSPTPDTTAIAALTAVGESTEIAAEENEAALAQAQTALADAQDATVIAQEALADAQGALALAATQQPTDTDEPPTVTTTPSHVDPSPTNTATPTPVPSDTPTEFATNTPAPTDTATPRPTNTTEPSPSNTPMPTNTPRPTNTPTNPAPTVLYPDGRLLTLLYDNNSFYVHNGSGSSVRVSQLSFEALDEAGTPLAFTFDGSIWSRFFRSVEPNRCNSIEITTAPRLLAPDICRGYNARTTLSRADTGIFWTDRAAGFRVLWADNEVARCENDAGECTFRVP